MRKTVCWTICLVWLFAGTALAGFPEGYGVSLGYGESRDGIDIYRLGVQRGFGTRWFDSGTGFLSGYVELSGNRWEKSGETVTGVALSPVFTYSFHVDNPDILPFVEGGIGVAYIDEYHIAGRNLSTNFQFEDRIGIGVRLWRVDVKFGYMHYSNASIKAPNDGIDIWLGTLGWRF